MPRSCYQRRRLLSSEHHRLWPPLERGLARFRCRPHHHSERLLSRNADRRGEHGRLLYLRLRDELTALILSGRIRDGDMMPSVRMFAQAMSVNPLTVAKAYQPLLQGGVLVSRRGVGLFVAEGGASLLRQIERARFLKEQWPSIRDEIDRLGLAPVELLSDALSRKD